MMSIFGVKRHNGGRELKDKIMKIDQIDTLNDDEIQDKMNCVSCKYWITITAQHKGKIEA